MSRQRNARFLILAASLATTGNSARAYQNEADDLHGPRHFMARLASVRLVPLVDHEDESAYLDGIALRAEELAKSVGADQDAAGGAEALLAAANLLLSHHLEPALSRALLDLPNESRDLDRAREAIQRASGYLAQADEILRRASATEDEAAPARRHHHEIELLQAFCDAGRALLIAAGAEDEGKTARKAASRISVLLEDANPRVTAAAVLWYAMLRSREPDREAAVAVLDAVLSDPSRQAVTHGFFSRLLRCRLVAQQGGYAVAIALLTQLEDQCQEWFSEDAQRSNARRTVVWTHLQVLLGWHERLTDPARSAERHWCANRIDALLKEHFTDDHPTLLRLHLAVPVMIEPAASQKPPGPTPGNG